MTKDKRIILDGVEDHIVLHVATFNTAKEMWDVVIKLYENPSKNQKMILKKLRTIKMQKGESVPSYLIRIQMVRDEVATVE